MQIAKCRKCGRGPLEQISRVSPDGRTIYTRFLCPFCLDRFEASSPNSHYIPFTKPLKPDPDDTWAGEHMK